MDLYGPETVGSAGRALGASLSNEQTVVRGRPCTTLARSLALKRTVQRLVNRGSTMMLDV